MTEHLGGLLEILREKDRQLIEAETDAKYRQQDMDRLQVQRQLFTCTVHLYTCSHVYMYTCTIEHL